MTKKFNYTLEEYYSKIMPEVKLVSSFIENKNIKNLITRCRLKPYGYKSMFGRKLNIKYHWIDEFGNSVIFNKKIKIIENDLTIPKSDIKYTDMYCGLSINDIIKISKKIHIIYGKEQDYDQDFICLTFLGIDNYYRTYIYNQNQWIQISSILLGIDRLISLIESDDVVFFAKLNSKDHVVFPCKYKQEWVSSLPINQRFWKESNIDKQKINNLGVNI